MKKFLFTLLAALCVTILTAQNVVIHAHNDYNHRVPFYQSYSQGIRSIEADVFLHSGALLVGHDIDKLTPQRTFEALYLKPIAQTFASNGNKAWSDSDEALQLMVDIKSHPDSTLAAIIAAANNHSQLFGAGGVRIVISGGMTLPPTDQLGNYPQYLLFDGNIDQSYSPAQLDRVAMMSVNFHSLSSWKGKGSIEPDERARIAAAIAKAHALNKPIRFWGAPDGVTAWYFLNKMGADYINTDKPEKCSEFFRKYPNSSFKLGSTIAIEGEKSANLHSIIKEFGGFNAQKQQLSKRIDTYSPSFRNDGSPRKIKNVILLIGDGMSLTQLAATEIINRELTITKIRNIGIQRNFPLDNGIITTCSAASGSALATGQQHLNSHIAMSGDGQPRKAITTDFVANGYSSGVVTFGNLADATPAAFYGHSTKRSNSDEITSGLLDGTLNILCGSHMTKITDRKDGRKLLEELKQKYTILDNVDGISSTDGKIICVDERLGLSTEEATIGLLATTTRKAIDHLTKASNKGFFLMVEGTKIDYAGHANNVPALILETLGFDMAVAEALRFADSNGETLVIVTGDHETGGLTLIEGDREKGEFLGYYVTEDHTPIPIPVFAYGPHSGTFAGMYNNFDIPIKIRALLGFK